nr:hypothetical protein [Tanacetum cinerariifolium]
MKACLKHIDWGQVKITKGKMEWYVMPKYGKTNWMKDDSWIDTILDDVYDTFYRDEKEKAEVAKKKNLRRPRLRIIQNVKGKRNVHDIHNKIKKLEVNLARAIKAKHVDDHDDDLDTLNLENRIKNLEEDFGRLLKAKEAKKLKKANEAKKEKETILAELKAKKAKEAMLAEVVQISNDEDDSSDEDPAASTFARSKASIASTSNAQADSTDPRGKTITERPPNENVDLFRNDITPPSGRTLFRQESTVDKMTGATDRERMPTYCPSPGVFGIIKGEGQNSILNHICKTTTTTTSQNSVGIVQVKENPVRIKPGDAGIVQVAKFRKQSDIHEGGDESVLSTEEYIRKVVDDVGEDEDFRDGSWVSTVKKLVAIIKSYTPNALDLTVTLKDLSVFSPKPSMLYLSITMRNMVKVFFIRIQFLVMEVDLYKFDEEALDLALEEEARQAQDHQEWLEKCRQEEQLDDEHERQLWGFYGTI